MSVFASVSESVGRGEQEGKIKTRDVGPETEGNKQTNKQKTYPGSALSSAGDNMGWKSSVQESEDLRGHSS